METNPQLDDEVTESPDRPTDAIVEGRVVEVLKGTRAEIFLDDETDVAEADDPKYGEWSDEVVQVEVEVHNEDGEPIPVYDSFNYYENPSDMSAYGKYIELYGHPAQGQTVKVDFDSEGQGKIRGIRD